jgi:2-haloacid dehalogenase
VPQYRWLLFDADGTLFDFAAAEREALTLILSDLGIDCTPQVFQTYKLINDRLWQSLASGLVSQDHIKTKRFELLLDELGIPGDHHAIGHDYAVYLSQQTQLLDGAHETIEALAPHYRMVILTNGLKEVQRPRFSQSSLSPFFTDIVVSGEVGVSKPDPGIFAEAMRRMGSPSQSEVLMIGDNLGADVEGARRFGIDSCWCNFHNDPTPSPATHTITHIRHLLRLL